MKIKINYNKIKFIFYIKINKKLLINFQLINKKKIKKINSSILNYNYNLFLKILRNYGLIKSLKNNKDYL
jgi:hypothetical protein